MRTAKLITHTNYYLIIIARRGNYCDDDDDDDERTTDEIDSLLALCDRQSRSECVVYGTEEH